MEVEFLSWLWAEFFCLIKKGRRNGMRLEPSLDGSRPTTLHATIWEMIWNCYEAG